eukprot:jgi/Ulvmu1/3191/UM015_0232.1
MDIAFGISSKPKHRASLFLFTGMVVEDQLCATGHDWSSTTMHCWPPTPFARSCTHTCRRCMPCRAAQHLNRCNTNDEHNSLPSRPGAGACRHTNNNALAAVAHSARLLGCAFDVVFARPSHYQSL